MLWPADKYDVAFSKIVEDSLAGGTTILMLVAPEPDAVASHLILKTLLKAEDVQFQVKPVGGYDDLLATHEEIVNSASSELKSVVLLGCGAMLNLADAFPLPASMTCYVIDSHRPVDHRNIHCDAQYVIFSDVLLDQEQDEIPSDDEDEDASGEAPLDGPDAVDDYDGGRSIMEDDSDFDSDDSENAEQELDGLGSSSASKSSVEPAAGANAPSPGSSGVKADGGSTAAPAKKRKRDEGGPYQEGQEEPLMDTADGAGSGTTSSASELRRERIRKLQAYYSGTKTGAPAAYVAYDLASQLGRSSNDMLWYAIVGVTSHYAQGHLDNDVYSGLHMRLRDWVNANNSNSWSGDSVEGGNQSVNGPKTTLAIDDDDKDIRIRVPDEGRISVKNEEYRLMLYRHWSMYEAMYHSHYVSTQLSTWVEAGRQRLDTFLAKMGISKQECMQPFSYMSTKAKKKLHREVLKFKSEYDLDDLQYRSFTRVQGYAKEISAADAAHAVLAMLECGSGGQANNHRVRVPGPTAEGSSVKREGGGIDENIASEEAYAAASAERLGVSFHRACMVLQTRAGAGRAFNSAVNIAQRVQQAVLRQGVAVIQQRLLTNAGKFRYAYLSNMSDGDLHFFRRPALLSKLSHWLIAALLSKNRKRKASNDLPVVLCVLDEERQVYICVGTPGPKETRNRFGEAFRKAADTIEVRYKHTGFTSSVIEVEKEHVQNFTDQLYLTLENMDKKRFKRSRVA